jgi:hypothetical protein
VAMVGEKGIHRPVRDQVAAPGRRVQLVIGGVVLGAHARGVCPAEASSANHRIDTANSIGGPRPFSRLLALVAE